MFFRLTGLIMGAALLFSAAPAAARNSDPEQVQLEARIIAVSAGDAMQLLVDFEVKDFKLNGVECPVGEQPFAREARSYTCLLYTSDAADEN